MKPQLSMGTLKDAFLAFACGEWRKEIRDILKSNVILKDEHLVTIPDRLIDRIRNEGSKEMKEYVEGLGIILEEDKNAFVNTFMRPTTLYDISKMLFGNPYTFTIAHRSAGVINRPDLHGRSFYVSPEMKVILHKIKDGDCGTVIEIVKK